MNLRLWREVVAVGTYLRITGTEKPHTDCQEHFLSHHPGLTSSILDNFFVFVLDL